MISRGGAESTVFTISAHLVRSPAHEAEKHLSTRNDDPDYSFKTLESGYRCLFTIAERGGVS